MTIECHASFGCRRARVKGADSQNTHTPNPLHPSPSVAILAQCRLLLLLLQLPLLVPHAAVCCHGGAAPAVYTDGAVLICSGKQGCLIRCRGACRELPSAAGACAVSAAWCKGRGARQRAQLLEHRGCSSSGSNHRRKCNTVPLVLEALCLSQGAGFAGA